MTASLRKLLALPGQERWFVCRAWCLLPVAELSLRLVSFPALDRGLDRLARTRRPGRSRRPSPERCRELVEIAARHQLGSPGCLHQALVLRFLLALRAVPSRVRFGARRAAGCIQTHAWLEVGGKPLEERHRLDRFSPLRTAPPRGETSDLPLPTGTGSEAGGGGQGMGSADGPAPASRPRG